MSTADRGKKRRREDPPQRVAVGKLTDSELPSNLDAEIGVLGSMLILPEVCDDVATVIRAADFYDPSHRTIFEHLLELHNGARKVDVQLLVDSLQSAGEFDHVGGAAYLGKLIDSVPHAAHAQYYAEIVSNKATYRSLILACTDILRSAYQESEAAHHLLNQAEQKIFSILDSRDKSGTAPISDLLDRAMDRLEAKLAGNVGDDATETRFSEFDAMTGGLHPGEFVVLAARPSMGKTALALNIAENVGIHSRVPVLFVSLEMSSTELADRLLCSIAQVSGHKLRNGTVSRDERRRLVRVAGEIHSAPLFVDDSPSRTVTEIAAGARRIQRQEKRLGLIVIDYLQLVEPDNPRDPRQEQVARITRRLKAVAREVKVPILCLAQLNRQAEDSKDHRPRLSHLRESGAIEQDADVVMFIHREEYYRRGPDKDEVEGQAELIIAKQRNGPVGDVPLVWRKEFTRFEDRAPDRHSEFDDYNAASMPIDEQPF